jgi:UDP-glucose 4-epimerase
MVVLMKKVLITGSTGLIGYEVISQLLGKWAVYAVSRRPNEYLSTHTEQIICDLSQSFDTSPFPERVDAVIHLAQSEHFRNFPEKVEDIFTVNTLATLKLLEYARKAGAKNFILASSGGVYGYGDEEFSEEKQLTIRDDLGFYLSSKLCSELIADNYSSFMNIVSLRFFFVYGPRQNETMLIPRLIKNIKNGNAITLQGSSGIMINPTYVSDAAEAVVRSLDLTESCKINVGGPEVLRLRQICDIIGDWVDRKPIFEVNEGVDARNLFGSTRVMRALLCEPKVRFKEGIRSFI